MHLPRTFGGILAAVLFAGLRAAPGQVEIAWTFRHNRTVLLEPILASVHIANYSGRALDLTPHGNATLAFDVEDQPTSTVPKAGTPLLRKPVIIPPNETREVEVNLLDGYRILKGQTYMVRPVLETGGMRFLGDRQPLEVQPGLVLLERKYGMPGSPEARGISLRLINRDRSDRLFFRLDNPTSGYCLGVYDLGRVIRFFVPVLEQDPDGTYHVLHQSGPNRFTHSEFDSEGAPAGTSLYLAETGAIHFERGDDGLVAVAGGTPFTLDPENPGMLTAPELPSVLPAIPRAGTAAPAKKKTAEKKPPAKKAPPAAKPPRGGPENGQNDADAESISW